MPRKVDSIHLNRLEKSFGSHHVFGPITERIDSGVLALVVGPNGSGKTTLLRCIGGLEAYDGEIEFNNHESHSALSVVFDDPAMPRDIRARWLLRMYGQDASVIDNLGLGHRLLNEKIRSLSFGQRRRLALAVALARSPSVVLLDEPLAGVDGDGRAAIVSSLATKLEEGVTVIATTHLPSQFAELTSLEIRLEMREA